MASWYQVEGRETGWWESGCCPLGAGLSWPPRDSHWSQLPLSPLADRPLLDPSPDPRWRVTCDPGPQHTRGARGPCTPISRPGWSAVGKPITSFGSLARLSESPTPSNRTQVTTRPFPPPLVNRYTGTRADIKRIEGALVPLASRARTAARPESTEIAMSGWPMEQVPKKLTAGISFPGTRKTCLWLSSNSIYCRAGHVHTDTNTLPASFVHCHGAQVYYPSISRLCTSKYPWGLLVRREGSVFLVVDLGIQVG